MKEKIKILHLEDDDNDFLLISERIKSVFRQCEFIRVSEKNEYREKLLTEHIDLILSDFALPHFDGLTALKIKNELKPEIPFMFVSGHIGEERAIEALKNGALDYVLKDRLEKLLPAVRRTLQESETKQRRKEAEYSLRKSEARLKATLQSITDGFFTLDRDWRFTFVNNEAERLIQRSESYLLNKIIWEEFTQIKNTNFETEFRKSLSENVTVSFEEFFTTQKVWVEVTAYPSEDGLTVILHDITLRMNLVSQLVKAKEIAEQSNNLKDAFIANISHEIRTPLNGILGFTSIIKEIYLDEVTRMNEDLFNAVQISSKRLLRTVDMILHYSQLQTKNFPISANPFDLILVCENLKNSFLLIAKEKEINLLLEKKIDQAPVFADEYSVTEAVSNLLDNALKYTRMGAIRIIIDRLEGDLILTISDTGIGISKEFIDKIFEPYIQEEMGYSRSYEGIGLGLSLVKQYMDLNKIDISVQSEKNTGTTFKLNFRKVQLESA